MCPIHHDSGVCKSKISSESISAVQNWSDTHPETDECFEIRKPRKLTEKEVYILKGFKAMGYEYIAVDMTQNVYGLRQLLLNMVILGTAVMIHSICVILLIFSEV